MLLARCQRAGGGRGGGRGPDQLKYRRGAVGVSPLSRDLHLEQSPENRHSPLSQEIKADSDLMRKVNLPNFYAPPPSGRSRDSSGAALAPSRLITH